MRMQLLDFVRPKGLENMIKFHSGEKKNGAKIKSEKQSGLGDVEFLQLPFLVAQ